MIAEYRIFLQIVTFKEFFFLNHYFLQQQQQQQQQQLRLNSFYFCKTHLYFQRMALDLTVELSSIVLLCATHFSIPFYCSCYIQLSA